VAADTLAALNERFITDTVRDTKRLRTRLQQQDKTP